MCEVVFGFGAFGPGSAQHQVRGTIRLAASMSDKQILIRWLIMVGNSDTNPMDLILSKTLLSDITPDSVTVLDRFS